MGFKVDGKITVTGQANSKFKLEAPNFAAMGTLGLNSGATDGGRTIDANGDTWIAGFEGGYAARSTDNGDNWTALPQYLNSGATAGSWIYKIRSDGNGVWVAVLSHGYAARSVDDGATWTALPQQLNSGWFTGGDRGTGTWTSLGTDKQGNWVAGGADGFCSRSVDNGATWSGLPRGLGASQTDNAFWAVAANPAAAGDSFVAGGNNAIGSWSDDDGATWNLNAYLGNPFANTFSGDYNSGKYIMGQSGGAMRVSTDEGQTFVAGTTGFGMGANVPVYSVRAQASGIWCAGGTSGYASYSLDNGDNWAALPQGLNTAGSSTEVIYDFATNGSVWMAILADGYAVRAQ